MTGPNHRVSPKEAGQKLRQWLKNKAGASSKATNVLIDAGGVTVNGKVERFGSTDLKAGQVIAWNEAKLTKPTTVNSKQSKSKNLNPTKSPFKLSGGDLPKLESEHLESSNALEVNILYENDDLLVYLKPPGIPSQRTKDAHRINAEDLVARWAQKNGRTRTILVHRLDRDTSGLLLFGKGEASATRLADWFKHRQVHKTYFALCHGATSLGKGTWEHFLGKGKMIGGRQAYSCVRSGGLKAITDYEILASAQGFSLWKLQPHTGRTHQLRVQLAQANFPIVGDDLYGSRTPSHSVLEPAPHHYLHAGELCLPEEAGCPSPLAAPLPPAFAQALQQLGWLQHFASIG